MKCIITGGILLLLSSTTLAQDNSATIFNGAGSFTRAYGLQPDVIDGMHRVSGLKFGTGKRVEGTAFMTEDFQKGYIVFFNDKKVTEVPLKYNDLNEELYFDDNGKELILQTAVKEFGFTINNEKDTRDFVFRTGYPAIDNNTDKSFYQVLAGQAVLLLKRTTKKVQEAKELNGMEFLRIKSSDNYYAYEAKTRRIVKIKNGLENIAEALPDLKQKIEAIAKAQGLKCKSEKEMILLFTQL